VPIARWQDGTKNILFVGRFEPRKGLLDLLKAYRILRKTGCQCRLIVVGSGPQDKEVRRYLATRKLGGVEFLGRVSDDERDALFKTADVYCSPATGRESVGIVLLEAMAAGTAIVCSDIHGYKGVVRRGREALLVPPGRPKAIAGALATLLANDDMREAMGRSGLERAQEYSWERVTAKVEDYYGFVIRRLASQGQLPSGFHAPVPPSPRVPLVAA
jgi:phosphatidylinositol alpha-mannosyltransferase